MKASMKQLRDMPDDLPFDSTHRIDPVRLGVPSRAVLPLALVRAFALAGNATLTVVSKATGTRFTFRFHRPDDAQARAACVPAWVSVLTPTWVSVLTGPDNTDDFQFLGTIWEAGERLAWAHGRKSRIGPEAPSARVAKWLVGALIQPERLAQAEVWHEGRCGRCGRTLTVPESIETGFGPECAAVRAGERR